MTPLINRIAITDTDDTAIRHGSMLDSKTCWPLMVDWSNRIAGPIAIDLWWKRLLHCAPKTKSKSILVQRDKKNGKGKIEKRKKRGLKNENWTIRVNEKRVLKLLDQRWKIIIKLRGISYRGDFCFCSLFFAYSHQATLNLLIFL